MLHADITGQIIGAFYDVHREHGPGFSEAIYSRSLGIELGARGLLARREVPIEVTYRGVAVGLYRVDMLVEAKVIVEVKAAKSLTDGDDRQVLSYLKASGIPVGLLLNFGPSAEFRRLVNSQSPRR